MQHTSYLGFSPTSSFWIDHLKYAKCDRLLDAQKLFDEMPERDFMPKNKRVLGGLWMTLL